MNAAAHRKLREANADSPGTHHASRTKTIKRAVEPELLDSLPPNDPRAIRSRKDLKRVNAWMGNGRTMARALCSTRNDERAAHILELGAGDGSFLLGVARRLRASWLGTRALLLDRLDVVARESCEGFAGLGWHAEGVQAEALAWLAQPGCRDRGMVVANLFLHHFGEDRLTRLLRAVANSAQVFIAIEPRRCRSSAFFSRWLCVLGCSPVTVHDAQVSVQAGFSGSELSGLWPEPESWTLLERPAGWGGHLFVAQRKG